MNDTQNPDADKKAKVLVGDGFLDNIYVSWGLLIAVLSAASIGLWTLSGRYHTTKEAINRATTEVEKLNVDVREYYRTTDARMDKLSERVTVLETKMNNN